MTWIPPNDLDTECLELCTELNLCPGIRTIESCCGHEEKPYCIWFRADSLKDLPLVCYCFDGCHCGYYDWKVIASTDCGMSPITFMIEGPAQNATEQAFEIAAVIREEREPQSVQDEGNSSLGGG